MPSFDLRVDGQTLDPLSPFKMLAVMCHPGDRDARERMIGLIQTETAVGTVRRRPFTSEQFLHEIKQSRPHGDLAGALLLTLLQLHVNRERATLNSAIRLLFPLLPSWKQPIAPDWSPDAHVGHYPRSRRKILGAFHSFRSVSHLWAALLHGQQHGRTDIWPSSNETLPIFLSYANAFAEKGAALPWSGRDRRFTLDKKELWSFLLPNDLTATAKITGLPLNDDQRRVLNEL